MGGYGGARTRLALGRYGGASTRDGSKRKLRQHANGVRAHAFMRMSARNVQALMDSYGKENLLHETVISEENKLLLQEKVP